ncbi:hypothetical protein ELI17_10495 [Rhizobium ruizarguesonis]|uniref:hypothetical protein n=1 Tax=Rhizobium ruizarguesonis TaxID=2081791 RepID=UPI00103194EE|nr:hypothetical protein [Rhizobium ruizarguesonis]TBY61128.1 hypothetical protein E0H46_29955 [Rhizobium leguminosarum bv. viciae]TAU05328.1 hypothetical protein ELI55_10885 [Rhizobium ruizarguesonis]TAW56725.1 hypothetical protein ELI17_10495 [Rhizobium ruizarguesonis]TAZ23379.1 hypothetical protein ELH74_37990 [Rhizobium ruizarguesonis]TBC78343.1 hypothetical protein ELH30_10470 [Rhizobium ruizarguesonis]
MRRGSQKIILGLRISDDPEDVVPQIINHMRSNEAIETVLDVMWALYAASGSWPQADAYFRLYVRAFPELWASELSALSVSECYVASVETLQALGMPKPEGADRVAQLARDELARRGFPPVSQ